MKKLVHLFCVAFAVWVMTLPAFADIIWDPPSPRPNPRPGNDLLLTLILGVVVIAAAILARTIIRKRKEKGNQS